MEAVKRAAIIYSHQQEETKKSIDWEERRYEIAKSVAAGLVSYNQYYSYQGCAEKAVKIADALIEELKKK